MEAESTAAPSSMAAGRVVPVRQELVARLWFAVTALVVVVALVIQTWITAEGPGVYFDSAPARVFNMFWYFTIDSNIVLGVTSLLLALDPRRRGPVFVGFRLAGVVGIAITGIVYHLVLADSAELEGSAALTNALLHTAAPVLGVIGWLVFGPRRLVSPRVVGWALMFPVVWLVLTLVRGPIVDYYPYPFLDVIEHGYAKVLVNVTVVALLFAALSFGAMLLDRVLPGLRARDPR
jgi:hypothetical protein